jgi:hypothetical protein
MTASPTVGGLPILGFLFSLLIQMFDVDKTFHTTKVNVRQLSTTVDAAAAR